MPNAIYSSTAFQFDVSSETAYNSGTVGTDYGALGIGGKFTSYELDNAWTELYEIGQRIPQAFYSKGLQAPTALNFAMCQDQVGWMGFVLGAPSSGTYTVGNSVQTGMVTLGTPQNNIFTVGGIAFQSLKLSIQQGSAVMVDLNGVGTSFGTQTGTITPGSIPTQLLTWKDCSLGGSTINPTTSLVQSINLTINTNATQYYALGSAQFQTYLPLASDIECQITAFHNDPAYDILYSAVVGNSAAQGGTVTVNIGTHVVTLAGTYLTKGSMSLEPVKEVLNDLSFKARQITFV